jgi:hypothetical protein
MNWIKAALLTGLLSAPFMNVTPEVMAADYGRGNACRRGDRLQIKDLDMSPDPMVEGQRIRSWKVRVQFDGNRECETEISVREGGDIVAQARRINLRPGVNEIDLRPVDNYRLRGREHCFKVEVDLEGSRKEVDAARRFCAQQRSAWSLREPGDRDRPAR